MDEGILVTGADQHQALGVIRGLGREGLRVIAGTSDKRLCLGFWSRFTHERALYRSPLQDPGAFVDDVLEIVDRYRVGLIVPATESTMVALNGRRDVVEARCRLAAADPVALDRVVDKMKTVELALRTGVPVPKTFHPATVPEALAAVADCMRFPVALKPRGNRIHASTRHRLGFKVRYAEGPSALERLLRSADDGGPLPLVQEFVAGTGACVSCVFDHGEPVAMLQYRRLREVPLTGGISVLRESVPLDPRLAEYVKRLLGELRWHGAAMVEFKHDADSDRYWLMEVNGRFPASAALSLDAGVNLALHVYRLFTGRTPPSVPAGYRPGVVERWLRGDIEALLRHVLDGAGAQPTVISTARRLPSRAGALRVFLRDFRPGVRYDEFKLYDPGPGIPELVQCCRVLLRHAARSGRELLWRSVRPRRASGLGRMARGPKARPRTSAQSTGGDGGAACRGQPRSRSAAHRVPPGIPAGTGRDGPSAKPTGSDESSEPRC